MFAGILDTKGRNPDPNPGILDPRGRNPDPNPGILDPKEGQNPDPNPGRDPNRNRVQWPDTKDLHRNPENPDLDPVQDQKDLDQNNRKYATLMNTALLFKPPATMLNWKNKTLILQPTQLLVQKKKKLNTIRMLQHSFTQLDKR